MDPKILYKQKLISIPEAVSLVQSHQKIATGIAAAEASGLLTELGKHCTRVEDVTVWVCLPLRMYDYINKPEMSGHFFSENWFFGAPDRVAHSQGRNSFLPANLHAAGLNKLKANGGHVNIFWGTATPPDSRGYMSLSLGLVVEKDFMEAADMVVLEINENLPWTLGDTHVHISDVDYVVENHIAIPALPVVPSTDWEKAIGGYISELIEDGATIQLGIGGIPNAITPFLMERRGLGVHTEMYTDGMVDLYEAGVITGKNKTLHKDKMIGAFALGSKKLYDFVNNNLGVEFQRGRYTNNPAIIGQNYKMISVNTALQVDINGQVCSQSIGVQHYSGTGGQLDYHRGAQLSHGGRGIIALRSTAKDETISTIVPILSHGSEITVPCHETDTIVTEYGVAELKGLCVKDRMEALIKIAHPKFRDFIREEAHRLGIVPHLAFAGADLIVPKLKATAPGVSSKIIKLWTFCDLSWPNAAIGMGVMRGFMAYYNHINNQAGVCGRRIDVVMEDDGFNPVRTKKAAEKLINKDQVFAIVSPQGTPTNLAVLDYLVEQNIPVIAPVSGSSAWSVPLKSNYFALQPSYLMEGRLIAQYVMDELKPSSVAVFAVDDPFGNEGAASFAAEMSKLGLKKVHTIKHQPGECDPVKWVEDLQACSPDLVLLYTYIVPASELLAKAHDVNFKPSWIGTSVVSTKELIRFAGDEATHGVRTICYPRGPIYHRGPRLFRMLMQREYGDIVVGTDSVIGYAAAQLVVEGMKQAGPELTRKGFVAALESLKDWTGGLLPSISYSATDHRGLTSLALQRAIKGKWMQEKSMLRLKE